MAETKALPVKLDRVLVGVDFGDASIEAATWTARAFAPGAEIVLAHAIHVPEPPGFLSTLYPSAERALETAREGAELKLRELSRTIATGLVWPEVRVGAPEVVVAQVARDYGVDLIVLGRRTERPGVRDRLGGTPERVLRRTRLPLLLAATTHEGPPRRMLAAIDESAVAGRVLEWTDLLLTRDEAASATLVHTVSPLPPLAEDTSLAIMPAADGMTAVERTRSREASGWLETKRSAAARAGQMRTLVRIGRPATAIVEEATRGGFDLVVLGTHGRGALGRLAFGSVSEEVLRAAPCPVLVVE